MGDKLAKALEKKISEIQEKYKEPPARTVEEPTMRPRYEGRRRDRRRRR